MSDKIILDYDPKKVANMEKIRISVSNYTYDILLKDMDAFDILKSNGEVNRNEFLNKLILNYADEYLLKSKKQLRTIEGIIDKHVDLDEYDRTNLTNDILESIKEQETLKNNKDESIIISLKPTKESEPLIDYIINEQIENQSISSFFRQMFDSYVNMTQNNREKVLFSDVYDLLIKSINRKRKVYLNFRNKKGQSFLGSLYCVKSNTEELFNYCLFDVNGKQQTVRLCKIKSVKITNEPASINPELIPVFDFQIENSLAYPVTKKDFEIVVIKMNELGEKMYRKTFLYRPRIYKKDGDMYYFKGSHMQIFNYFKRFGGSAIIVSPQSLKERMEKYYRDSFYAYKNSKDD